MSFLDKFSKKKRNAPAAVKAEPKTAAPKKEAVSPAKVAAAKDGAGDAYRILVTPLFTEKSDRLQTQGKYSFLVAPTAGKVEIGRAIRDLYGVKPTSVRIVKVHGKAVRFGRTVGKEKNMKKAIVTLAAGDTLTVLGNV